MFSSLTLVGYRVKANCDMYLVVALPSFFSFLSLSAPPHMLTKKALLDGCLYIYWVKSFLKALSIIYYSINYLSVFIVGFCYRGSEVRKHREKELNYTVRILEHHGINVLFWQQMLHHQPLWISAGFNSYSLTSFCPKSLVSREKLCTMVELLECV